MCIKQSGESDFAPSAYFWENYSRGIYTKYQKEKCVNRLYLFS